jgi:signal transduction histidine kinase
MKELKKELLELSKNRFFPYLVIAIVLLLLVILRVNISALILALAATFLLIAFNTHRTNRQKKALILLFAKEFMLLFERCKNYYNQMLIGGQSKSTLFEISDSTTVAKLGEVGTNISVIEAIMTLKANFFQVIRWAHMATRIDPKTQKLIFDRGSRDNALAFFMGDAVVPGKKFGMVRYKEYKEQIEEVLGYLAKISSEDFDLGKFLHLPSFLSNYKEQNKELEEFIKKSREDLNKFAQELDKLRFKHQKKHMIKKTP